MVDKRPAKLQNFCKLYRIYSEKIFVVFLCRQINGIDMKQSTIDRAVELLQGSKKKVSLLVQKNFLQKLVVSIRPTVVSSVLKTISFSLRSKQIV